MTTDTGKSYDVNNRFSLYYYKTEKLWISVEAYFSDDKLRIDGCDSGDTVESYWGDWDFEYWMTLPAESVEKLYKVLGVGKGERESLLIALKERAHGKDAFEMCRDFFDTWKIKYEAMSWV